jgi:hypothetical protein
MALSQRTGTCGGGRWTKVVMEQRFSFAIPVLFPSCFSA